MENTEEKNGLFYSLTYGGKSYVSYLEEDLLEEGIPQSEIDKEKTKHVQAERQEAYKVEADPLYMEWQYDQTLESEKAWRDKVAEIKARYPLPVES
jgi:hypothetical protein